MAAARRMGARCSTTINTRCGFQDGWETRSLVFPGVPGLCGGWEGGEQLMEMWVLQKGKGKQCHRRCRNRRKKAEQTSEGQPDPRETRIESSALLLNGPRREIS